MIGTILTVGLMVVLVANMILDYRKIKLEDDNKSKLLKLEQEVKSLSIACLNTAKSVEGTATALVLISEKVNELRSGEQPKSLDTEIQK